jgi:hypothetical protein
MLMAQLRRHKVAHELELPRDRDQTSARLVGYSNADIEALVLGPTIGPRPPESRSRRRP